MKLKRQQKGLTFLGLIIVGVLLALAGLVGAQVFPTYLEYVAVQKAVTKASEGNTVAEVRAIFDKAAAIDDIRMTLVEAINRAGGITEHADHASDSDHDHQ